MTPRISTMAAWIAMCVCLTAQATELAKINGHSLSEKDMESALTGMNEGQRTTYLKDPNSRRQVLSGVIDQELLMTEAEREKLDQDNSYREAFTAFKRSYLSTRVLEKNVEPKVTSSAAKRYYELHKNRFSTDEVVVEHILLDTEAEAREMLKKARAPDADFMELAEKYSKDPAAKNNRGHLGAITQDAPLVKEFKDVAFRTPEGEVAGPVKTPFGYHLIKVIKRKMGHSLTFDESELRVKGELRQELVQDYISGLKKTAKIQIDDKALDRL